MPLKFSEDTRLTDRLAHMMDGIEGREHVALSLIDLTPENPNYAGFQDTQFRYTASIPKAFVAWAMHECVARGLASLYEEIEVGVVNHRPLDPETPPSLIMPLQLYGRYSVQKFLNRMVSVSEDTAANILIDRLTREYINELIAEQGWQGSEVIRKFLPRSLDTMPYKEMPTTMGCTRHLAEFFFRVAMDGFRDRRISARLRELFAFQRDKTKLAAGFPKELSFIHKTGWFYDPDLPPQSHWLFCQADCGIAEGGGRHFVIACVVNDLPRDAALAQIRDIGRMVPDLFPV